MHTQVVNTRLHIYIHTYIHTTNDSTSKLSIGNEGSALLPRLYGDSFHAGIGCPKLSAPGADGSYPLFPERIQQ